MFDLPDFYPTPAELATEMLDGLTFHGVHTILEPSAGDGMLLDAIMERLGKGRGRYDIDAIEVQPNLRHILQGKGYRVVHDDFLTFQTQKHYDLIVANPPFSNGEQHLLRMLKMQEFGGSIICLLNAETLRNPRSAACKRLLRKLEDAEADIDYIKGAFTDANRPTGVEVALVKICIPEQAAHSFILDGLRSDERYEDQGEYNTLMDNNPFKAIVQQYQFEVRAGIRLIREYYAMRRTILADTFQGSMASPIIKLEVRNNAQFCTTTELVNEYVEMVRYKYWRALFSRSDFTRSFTSRLRAQFFKRVEELKHYDFSYFNIMELRLQMSAVMLQGLEEEMEYQFNELSHQYYWIDSSSSNIHYFDGWKTNKSWYINNCVVLPENAWSERNPDQYIPTQVSAATRLCDIERIFLHLDGVMPDELSVFSALEQAELSGTTKNIVCQYFNVSFYKKGTCHIKFTNPDLLRKFNIRGSRRKNWLPPSYGKAAYDDMSAEEQAVVDSFEGKASYEDTLRRRDYFLCEPAGITPTLEAHKDNGISHQ